MSSLSTSANYNQHSILNEKKFITKENTQESSNRSINSSSFKFYEIKNIYNKIDYEKLKGIKRYENFPIFSVRERDNKKKKKLILRIKNNVLSLRKDKNYLSSKSSVYITQNSSFAEFSQLPSIIDKLETNNRKKVEKIINYKYRFNEKKEDTKNYSSIEKNPIRNLFLFKLKRDYEKLSEVKKNNSANYLFNKKLYELNRFRTCENSPSTHINKLREFLNDKMINRYKKERFIRLRESKISQLFFEDDKMSSLQKSQRLLDHKYLIKNKEYLLRIYKEIDNQENIDKILCDKIIKLKKSIYSLKKKINKLLIEKNIYVKWMLFQVQIKEKLLKIPNHYKKLLKINNFQNLPDELTKYQQQIIYSCPEELIDKIKNLENKNIKLMQTLYQISKSIYPLKAELEEVMIATQRNRIIQEFNELLLLKEKEKSKNEILINRKVVLKDKLNIYPIKSSKTKNFSKLYEKIKSIYNNICGKDFKTYYFPIEEIEMLIMLKYIEITYGKENEFIKYYEKNNKEKLKMVKSKVIKDKIKERMITNKDVLNEEKKKLNKRILEKSSKATLIPTIKVNLNVFKIKRKVKPLININKILNKEDEEIENNFEFFNYE